MDNDLAARIEAARQALAELERLERQAQQLEQGAVGEHETIAGTSGSPGFWQDWRERTAAVTAPVTDAPGADLDSVAGMSYEQYAAFRSANGIGGRSAENLSRRPGVTQATGQGMFDGMYADPRQVNRQVFRSTLEDTRKAVPQGFIRPQTSEQQHDSWR